MRRVTMVVLPVVAAGVLMAGCSSPDGDRFTLGVHNPTPAAQARTQPDVGPAQDPYNRTIPTP